MVGLTQELGQAHFEGSFFLERECCNRQDERRPGKTRHLGQGASIGDPVTRQLGGLFIDDRLAPIIKALAHGPGKRREPEYVCDHTVKWAGQQVTPLQVNQFVHDDLWCVLFRDERCRYEDDRAHDTGKERRPLRDNPHIRHAPQSNRVGPVANRADDRTGCLLQALKSGLPHSPTDRTHEPPGNKRPQHQCRNRRYTEFCGRFFNKDGIRLDRQRIHDRQVRQGLCGNLSQTRHESRCQEWCEHQSCCAAPYGLSHPG